MYNKSVGYIEFNIDQTDWKRGSHFFGTDGIIIDIEDFMVQEDHRENGIGRELFTAMFKYVIPEYGRMNGVQVKDVFATGKLEYCDFRDRYWEMSIPFYINIAEKVLKEVPAYGDSRTVIGYSWNNEREEVVYDSGNQRNMERCGIISRQDYIRNFLDEMKNGTKYNVFVGFHFVSNADAE